MTARGSYGNPEAIGVYSSGLKIGVLQAGASAAEDLFTAQELVSPEVLEVVGLIPTTAGMPELEAHMVDTEDVVEVFLVAVVLETLLAVEVVRLAIGEQVLEQFGEEGQEEEALVEATS
eukprot:gene1591-2227_t